MVILFFMVLGGERCYSICVIFFFFQAEDGIRDLTVTGVQTCALPISVIVFRAKRPAATAYKPSVFCGKIALARLSYGGYMKIQLPPGKYSLGSSDDQVLELHLEEGQEVYEIGRAHV